MKTLKRLFILFLVFSQMGNAQENGNVQSLYTTELDKMVKVPTSPEAQAFAKYGDTEVSLYSGVPQVSVPLYTLEGREFNIPVSLTYDATGVKVEQLSTWVGLGWNLNVGGRVTRMVNGLADDYLQGDYQTINNSEVVTNIINYRNNSSTFNSPLELENYFAFLEDLSTNQVDAEPDYYTINAPGLNAVVVRDIEDNNILKALNNPRIDITKNTNGWTIKGEDGTTYEFINKTETTLKNGSDELPGGAVINEYESSWLLTKIISPNGKDTFEFHYTDFGYWAQDQLGSSAERVVMNFENNVTYYQEITPQYASGSDYKVKQQFLTSITHNGDTLMTVGLGARHDIDINQVNSRLDNLVFYDLNGSTLKTIDFDNDQYFNFQDGISLENQDRYDIRLKLDGLSIKGKNDIVYQNYEFHYQNPEDLPARDSYSQDYFGYYNGAQNNSLIPLYDDGTHFFEGADREPNTASAKIGMLTRIVYPTKGYTEFEFEGHDVYRTESTASTVNHLDISLNGSSVTDPALYLNDQGNFCDDQFIDYDNPKILFKVFTIPATKDYDVQFAGLDANSEGYIMYLGSIDESTCKTGPLGAVICSSPNDTYENYCDFHADGGNAAWHSNSNNIGFNQFDAGLYKAMIVLDESAPNTYGSINLTLSEQVTTYSSGNYDIGGLRIKEIRDYAAAGELAQTKFYSYRDENDHSTAHINFKPALSKVKSFNTLNNQVSQLIRSATFPKGDEPYVVYPSVREYRLDKNGVSEGYTEYKFHRESRGAVPRATAPFESSYYGNLKAAQPINTMVYDDGGTMVSKSETEFYETATGHVSINGWVAYTDEGNSDKVIAIKEYTQDSLTYYTYEYLLHYDCAGVSPCATPLYITNPQAFGYHSLLPTDYSALKGRHSFIAGSYGGVSKVTDTLFIKDAADNPLEIVTVKETTYDANVDYLPRTTRTIDSEGEVFETTSYYPKDNVVTGSNNLIAKNRLAEVVKSESFKDPDGTPIKIQATEKEYEDILGSHVMPIAIKTQKGQSTIEERLNFFYNTDGNLRQASIVNGPSTAYVWGYEDRYPVAVINNATSTDVFNVGLNMTLIGDPATSDSAMRNELDGLRTSLTNAMVTTYTYNPLEGVSSVTDPRGYTSYYVYDEFSRLLNVKEDAIASGNQDMVLEYEYGYKSEGSIYPEDPSSYPTIGGSIGGPTNVDYNENHNYTITPTGGSGNFFYTWYKNDVFIGNGIDNLDINFNFGGNLAIRVDILDTSTGATHSVQKSVTVNSNINISAIVADKSDFLTGETVTFTAPTVTGGSQTQVYRWYVNNTEVASGTTVQDLVYDQFNTANSYTIKYEVTDNGLTVTEDVTITVAAHDPLASFTINGDSHIYRNSANTYNAVGVSGGSGNLSYAWELVNGASLGTATTASFTPTSTGAYTIRLVVTDNAIAGHSQQAELNVNVHEPLALTSIAASRTNVLVGKTVDFTTNGLSGGSSNLTYRWYVGGNLVSGANGTTFSDSFALGTQSVYFEVEDGLQGTVLQSNTVNVAVHNPLTISNVTTTATTTTVGTTIRFNAVGVNGGSGSNTRQWYINGVPESGQTGLFMDKSFSSGGTYTVAYRITDDLILNDLGNDYYVEDDVNTTVHENLSIANLSAPSTVTVNTTASFDIDVLTGSGNYSYAWKIQKGSNIHNATTKSFSHNLGFDFYGSVYVECKVTDNVTGQQQTLSTNITVNGAPTLTGKQGIAQIYNSNSIEYHVRLNITNLNGSGDYSYAWTSDNQNAGTAATAIVYLDCNDQSDRMVCVITDNVTGQTKTTDKTYTFRGSCSGGGNQ